MRFGVLLGALGATAVASGAVAGDARACGGCFHEPTSQDATVVTDHRMVFSVSPKQTTLYDQIQYSGSPSSFAWVLPVHGPVTVGLSSALLFQALDHATSTTVLPPLLPVCPSCDCSSRLKTNFTSVDHEVTVTSHQVVGPYETVQLHPNSAIDTAAVTSWLDTNGYAVPGNVDSVIAAYVSEGFDFLALRLAPGQRVQAMRPVSVTTPGAGLTLPLRMVAAGTGAVVGITLWVIASGRYEPQNFAQFVVSAADLVWDWSAGTSNYTTLRTQKEATLDNAAWQIESSLDVSPYAIESVVLLDRTANAYALTPALDAGGTDASTLTPIEQRSQDLLTLFPTRDSTVRITRMRADLSQGALATDLVLQASTDQTTLSNSYQATKSVNSPACPTCPCETFVHGCTASAPAHESQGLPTTTALLIMLGIAYRRFRRT